MISKTEDLKRSKEIQQLQNFKLKIGKDLEIKPALRILLGLIVTLPARVLQYRYW